MPLSQSDIFVSRRLYSCALFHVGSFRCPVKSPLWNMENRIGIGPHLVFARVPVEITHLGAAPTIASPNHAMLYNAQQAYRRRALCDRGDECEWFRIEESCLRDALRAIDPSVDDRPSRPLRFDHAAIAAKHYFAQRRIYEMVAGGGPFDELWVQETFLGILAAVIRTGYHHVPTGRTPRYARTEAAHRDLAHDAQIWIGRNYARRVGLTDISADLGVSAFHLCRVFRRWTGLSLHQYLLHFRLRASLECVRDRSVDLTRIAFAFGFSSSAHFSSAFRSIFGVCPSEVRGSGRISPAEQESESQNPAFRPK